MMTFTAILLFSSAFANSSLRGLKSTSSTRIVANSSTIHGIDHETLLYIQKELSTIKKLLINKEHKEEDCHFGKNLFGKCAKKPKKYWWLFIVILLVILLMEPKKEDDKQEVDGTTEVGQTKEETDKKDGEKSEADALTRQQQEAEEAAFAEMMGSIFSTKRPKDFMGGLSSALKTMGKGVAMGAGLLVATPIVCAREEGAKGFCKGLAAGIAGAIIIPAAAVAVGTVQIGRGIVCPISDLVNAMQRKYGEAPMLQEPTGADAVVLTRTANKDKSISVTDLGGTTVASYSPDKTKGERAIKRAVEEQSGLTNFVFAHTEAAAPAPSLIQKLNESFTHSADQQSLNRDANLEERLEEFFHATAPHYKSRIPVIMDAYREWPMLLFGDLDHNYGTDFSRPVEKDVWDKEDLERKRIRVQVAQDYIYCAMNEKDYMHPREVGKYTQAKLGTSKARVPKQIPSKRMSGSRKRRAARKVVQGVSKVAGSIGARASTIRRSVKRASGSRKQRNQRLSAPQVVKVQNRP